MGAIVSRIQNAIKGIVAPVVHKVVSIARHALENTVRAVKTAAEQPKKSFVQGLKQHITKNPRLVALQAASLTIAAIPGAVTFPALGALGFSAIGPVGGSLAAGFQSAVGTPAVFSVLQSAAMGGYGVQAATGAVSASSVGSAAVLEVARRYRARGRRAREDGGCEGSEDGRDMADDEDSETMKAVAQMSVVVVKKGLTAKTTAKAKAEAAFVDIPAKWKWMMRMGNIIVLSMAATRMVVMLAREDRSLKFLARRAFR
ncbi:hypothetical protein MBLNU230_g7583t1 [Neophaeotheca triangularis]